MNTQQKQKILEHYILDNKNNFYKIAYSYTRNSEDALDVIQESIYKALKTITTLNEPEYIRTWFYRILVHTAIDMLRKNKKYVLGEELEQISSDSHWDTYENLDLKNALDSLASDQRIVVILRYFEDLKIQEIAYILNENLNTIKSRLYKALKNLKLEITAQEVEQYERARETKATKSRIL